MTAYQVMPPLTPAEFDDLYRDIASNGIRVPVDVDEDGNILDGHHRAEIAESLGIDFPIRELAGLTEEEKIAHAYAVNVTRRSLTREQKRDLIAESLRREPELSDRQHGARTGADGKTVASVREELESTADIPQSPVRKGADGRVTTPQPTRPATWLCGICGEAFKTAHTHCETCGEHYPEPVHCPDHTIAVNTATGEVLDEPKPLPKVPSQDLADVADMFLRIAKVNALIAKHMDFIADTWATGNDLERRSWAETARLLAERSAELAARISKPIPLRRVK